MGSPSAGDCFSEVSLVNTALSYQQARAVADAAGVVGTADEVRRYGELAESIGRAFNEHFLSADGTQYGSGRQTTSVLPLAFGLVPPQNVKAVGDQLVDTILTKDRGHLDTGIFGTRYLVDVLAKLGRLDVAMTILHQPTYPGFGFEISHGATTSWEQWLYDSAMETHDHAMFAGINASLYTELGGIKLTSPAYRTVTIAPEIPASLPRVSAALETVRGRIASEWSQTAHTIKLSVTIPVGTTATVVLAGTTRIVGSGHWTFTARK
jgi:alpha-L-rhamnosidase